MSEWVERFWQKVERGDDCWIWLARKSDGYGYFAPPRSVAIPAHRIAYELCVGPIPEGLQIDHLCRNRACVNPAHLEAVTLQENLRRGLGTGPANRASAVARKAARRCKRGHEFTLENTRNYRGRRHCRTCQRLHARRYRAERAAA